MSERGGPQTHASTVGHQLDARFVPQQRLVGRLRALAVSAISVVALLILLVVADGLAPWVRFGLVGAWLAAMACLAWFVQVWPARVYAHTRYRLDEDGLQIARGVYWRSVTHVPRSRVQHTDVSQGPLERRYGLGTLVVYTAGTDHAMVGLPGLAHETALQLRDDLRVDHADDGV
jgi:membrane protein YdbS with pleckstrin-like domain